MADSYCIVIPYYNHGRFLSDTVADLVKYKLLIIIVDDGSNELCRSIAQNLAENWGPSVQLISYEPNRGKGYAVMRGIELASRLGFRYAIQIDADGQHDFNDIPKFIQLSRANPTHVILGAPIFGVDAPRERIYCRFLCNIFMWFQIRSFSAIDGMFGFRVYPISSMEKLHQERPFTTRMGFDVEAVIRLVNDGVPATSIKSKVLYRPDGISHYHYLYSTLDIVQVHKSLILEQFGKTLQRSLSKIWSLVRKPSTTATSTCAPSAWHVQRELGSFQSMLLLLKIGEKFGEKALQPILRIVAGYFYLSDSRRRQYSRLYLQRVKKFVPDSKQLTPYRHYLSFAENLTKSSLAWLKTAKGVPYPAPSESLKHLSNRLRNGKGGVILSAHFGIIETLRARHASLKGVKIMPLMYHGNSSAYRRFLESITPNAFVNAIHADEITPATISQIQAEVDKGTYIVVLADRLPHSENERTIEVPFFGDLVRVPLGPFLLCYLLKTEVISLFCYRTPDNGEYFRCRDISNGVTDLKRSEYIQNLADLYIQDLQAVCSEAPLQWFNFYDYFGDFSDSSSLSKSS